MRRHEDKPCTGKLATLGIASEPSQLQQEVESRTSVELITPHIILDGEEFPSDNEESNDRISQ